MGHPALGDMIGSKFGRLTVLSRADNIKQFSAWLCKCECGTEKVIRGTALRAGKTVSCGCYLREIHLVHGRKRSNSLKRDRTYNSYASMKSRILNPNDPAYHKYGGRGIKICKEWLNGGFLQFLSDMGERPNGTTLDRIDNEGDYCPSNCRWANPRQQARNRRSTRLITAFGKTMSLSEWALELNTKHYKIAYQLQKGLAMEEVVLMFTNHSIQ